MSSFQTRYYDANDQSYEIDTTYYLNDENCTPKDSDICRSGRLQRHTRPTCGQHRRGTRGGARAAQAQGRTAAAEHTAGCR